MSAETGANREDFRHERRRKKRLAIGLGVGAAIIALSLGGAYVAESPRGGDVHTGDSERNAVEYPLHTAITATVFWVGDGADITNDYIHNRSSAWIGDWVSAFGGIDDPDKRCGYVPCGFTPKENSFYFALPFSDTTETGPRPANELAVIPWYDETKGGSEGSLLKNRWIEIAHDGKKAYAQWEDVGPFESNDSKYVFGTSRPKEKRAGLDVSPAVSDYLKIGGRATVDWRFVDESQVPDGPWREVITTSLPQS